MILLDDDIRQKRLVNLTPLIDIVFMLVVFFLLSSKFDVPTGVQLDMQSADITSLAKHELVVDDVLQINVLDDQHIEVAGKTYRYNASTMSLGHDISSKHAVVLMVYPKVFSQSIISLVEILQHHGIDCISMEAHHASRS